jgi:hypothetical protein
MPEFQGEKFVAGQENGSYYSADYVDWLEQRIEVLVKSNRTLRRQLESQRQSAACRYRDQSDYIPYPEDDRD